MVAKRLRSLSLSIRNTGWVSSLVYKWDRIRLFIGTPAAGLLRIKPKGLAHPLELRRGRSSDMEVYRAIFIEREYDALSPNTAPGLILDLGANVGASSVYFLNRFPGAKVVAVEPDRENFLRCRANLAPYGDRAIVLQGGVWPRRCHLEVEGQMIEGKEWAITVREAAGPGPGTVEAWDVPSLVELAGRRDAPIDVLKVDIEGSERQLFESSAQEWLPQVRNICIELHGVDCDRVFFRSLEHFRYRPSRSGELTLCHDVCPP